MNPQGSASINTDKYDSYKERVDKATSCEDLQKISTDILNSLKAESDAIKSQLEKLGPIGDLLSAPTSPSDVVTWVSNFIDGVLRPLYAPFAAYGTQIAARATAITELTDAINAKANEFQSCSITLPTLPPLP